MGKYWLKIGLGAMVIFLIGFGILSAGRRIHDKIESNTDIVIPLGGFIDFKLDGIEVGKLRSLTILRSAPKAITGFRVSARVSDSSMFERFRNCHVSVTDASHFDESTTFTCLTSDSGFIAFGEVRLSLPIEGGTTTIVQPLLLTELDVQKIRGTGSAEGAEATPSLLVDSLQTVLRTSVRARQRVYNDSVEAARLERRAREMQRRADSLRAKPQAVPPPAAPKP